LKPADVLIKLQSKHVAIYARTAFSRDRYPVQVDDSSEFVLDRDLWLRLRDRADELTRVLVEDGVPPYPAKLTLQSFQLPKRVSAPVAAAWPRLTAELKQHARATWWRIFCEFYPTPQEAGNATTGKGTSGKGLRAKPQDGEAPAGVPATRSRSKSERRQDGKGQVLLPLG
jgi:hypothetical protein